MKNFVIKTLTLGIFGTGIVSACGVENVVEDMCDEGQTPIYMMSGPTEEAGDCELECPPMNAPLPVPVMDCFGDGFTFYCGVFPRGPGLRYSWSSTPEVTLAIPGPTSISVQEISCQQEGTFGKVYLTVTSAVGLESRRTFLITCESTIVELEPGDPVLPDPPVDASH